MKKTFVTPTLELVQLHDDVLLGSSEILVQDWVDQKETGKIF